MSEELEEEQVTLEPEQETTPEESVEVEDLEKIKAEAAKAKEFKGFAEKTAIENKELKKKLKALETKSPPETSNANERFERLELKTEGYSREEIDFIMQNGGSKILENKDNNLVLDAIEANRKKRKSLESTPSGTNKSPVFQRYSQDDLNNMSLQDLEKIIPR